MKVRASDLSWLARRLPSQEWYTLPGRLNRLAPRVPDDGLDWILLSLFGLLCSAVSTHCRSYLSPCHQLITLSNIFLKNKWRTHTFKQPCYLLAMFIAPNSLPTPVPVPRAEQLCNCHCKRQSVFSHVTEVMLGHMAHFSPWSMERSACVPVSSKTRH